ncbi:putative 3-hydroxyacyl-CoA dehydrogenase [Myxozyma melibiosi]|uniref:3-hydroxyacyl-CoA dehydrogenase n=1 Tax=Myxozyma melibiosi TaxID=54550 RepID=A0ABR1F9L0_9ASCO
MSRFVVEPQAYRALEGKVVVLTGGANGIGAQAVKLFLARECKVVFGDVQVAAAESFIQSLIKADPTAAGRVAFVKTDVSSYDNILELFETARTKFGKVDVAVHMAALTEIGNWFEPDTTLESVKRKPTTVLVDVNMLGTLYFARIAAVYLKQGATSLETDDKSMILFSSVAGFKESPGLFVYQTTKHGVLGLMRCMRKYPPIMNHIRVNCVCPWMTLTGMVDGIRDRWAEAKLPANKPEDVAAVVVDMACAKALKGETIYVEGGRAWAIEGKLDETEPLWLGAEQSRSLNEGQVVLGDLQSGDSWRARARLPCVSSR